MLDHVSIPVVSLDRAAAFYDPVLATLGLMRRKERAGAIGYGPAARPAPIFWLLAQQGPAAQPGPGLHISFAAANRDEVDRFHAAGLAQGGADAGAPGERPHYTQPFYGGFVIDLDGFKVEAVCRTEPGR